MYNSIYSDTYTGFAGKVVGHSEKWNVFPEIKFKSAWLV